MVGLDVTMKTILRPTEIGKTQSNKKIGVFTRGLLAKAFSSYPIWTEEGGIALHDPLAIAAAIDPGIITTERMHLSVETDGNVSVGATIVDNRPLSEAKPNANIAIDVDSSRFKE
jgi:purine nucleosidase